MILPDAYFFSPVKITSSAGLSSDNLDASFRMCR